MQPETILYGVRKGNESWQEEIITAGPSETIDNARLVAARKWAESQGFDRFRVAFVDLSKPPTFGANLLAR